MKILFDIIHPVDVNFFNKTIRSLLQDNKIIITVLDRGNLYNIVKDEYSDMISKDKGIELIRLGKHRKGFFGKIFGILDRELRFIRLFLQQDKKFERVVSFGFYPAIAAKFFGIRSVLFHDDFEYKLSFNLCRIFADVFIIPKSIPSKAKNIVKYAGFKELAYLYDFKPLKSSKIMEKLNLKKDKFVFVREVESVSLNYSSLKKLDLKPVFLSLKKKGYDILYFPENIDDYKQYKEHVTLLKTPISKEEFFTLMKYARFCISSGDSFVREAALLGTPVIYTGKRYMSVNNPLLSLKLMTSADNNEDLINVINSILAQKKSRFEKIVAHKKKTSWKDTTKIILREIKKQQTK